MTRPKGARSAGRPAKPKAAAVSVPLPDATANLERGEHELELAGLNYVLRPSYGAQVAIEKRLGVAYMDLAAAGQSGALHITQTAVIVAEMVNAGSGGDALKMVSAERIGELIYEQGQARAAAVATIAIIDSLSGGRTAEGNAKAAAAAT